MSRLLPLALLPLALGLAWFVRDRAGGPAQGGDEGSAAHLRRIELALIEGRAPVADGFVDPPRGGALPAPPFLDAALALAAQRLWRVDLGGTGVVEEVALARGLRHLGPLSGLLGALGAALLAMAVVRSEWSGLAALIGAATFALWPGAVALGAAGRIDVGSIQAALAAFGAAVIAQTATSRDRFDWLQGGMSAGLFAALALLVGPGALLFVPAMALGFWALMLHEQGERRQAARRAGLFFALTAAVVSALAAGRLAGDGPAIRWSRGASELAFACGAPFLWSAVLSREERGGGGRLARGAGALVALALLPIAAWNLWPALAIELARWWASPSAAPDAGAAVAAAIALVAALTLRRSGDWILRGLAWLTLVLTPLGLLAPACAGPAAALACATVAAAIVSAPARLRTQLAGVVVLALGGLVFLRPVAGPDRELVDALRRARGVEPLAAWHSSTARAGPSWLAPWTLGHRLAHLARRPPTASGFGPGLAPRRARAAARALTARDEQALAQAARELGAGFVLAGRAIEREWSAVEALAGAAPYAGTALGLLARGASGADSPFVLVLRVGDGADPLLAVYALAGANAGEATEPSLQAR